MKCITFPSTKVGTIKSTSQSLTSKDGGDAWVSIIVMKKKKNHKMHNFIIVKGSNYLVS